MDLKLSSFNTSKMKEGYTIMNKCYNFRFAHYFFLKIYFLNFIFLYLQEQSVEMRREATIRSLMVYLREQEEDLFKDQLVGKSNT